MKRNVYFLRPALLLLLCLGFWARTQGQSWISSATASNVPNIWQDFRHDFQLTGEVPERYPLKIAVDSKYWLYVNDSLVVREGGLKRGPKPQTYYYDEVDIAAYLKAGDNKIALLLWYFGKEGFSHQSSKLPGIWIDGPEAVRTSSAWRARIDPAFGQTAGPQPNYRLPESNILYDASKSDSTWTSADLGTGYWPPACVIDRHPTSAAMESRPIPQWKNSGLKAYRTDWTPYLTTVDDTLKLDLPYNAQVTPYLSIYAPEAGMRLEILTDNYFGGGPPNVRTVYLTKRGLQEFETPGWMNGHQVWYVLPAGLQVIDLKYRESGFDTEFTGSFATDDAALNILWTKAQRTLYITMRDTYMDCPDRERAQWWGDVVNELGETFYAVDRKSDQLTRKAIRELMHWQREDSTIYSPVPAGNWHNELPMQMLASVGEYGIWHYYYNTGDRELLEEVYPAVKRYVRKWRTDSTGLVVPRKGGWTWGDWGENKDLPVLYNTWYYLALRGMGEMARVMGDDENAAFVDITTNRLKKAFDATYWNGTNYRSPDYEGETDERGHALAVVSGLAPKEYYPAIFEVFKTEEHASPYMEKYVLEALFSMGETDYAIERMKKRFGKMIASEYTTLFEGWGIGREGYGGGSYNHAWSGGGLTVMSQFLGGAEPTSVGWETFRINPSGWPAIREARTIIPTPRGNLLIDWRYPEGERLEMTVAADFPVTSMEVVLPAEMNVRGTNERGRKMLLTRKGAEGDRTVWRVNGAKFRLSGSVK